MVSQQRFYCTVFFPAWVKTGELFARHQTWASGTPQHQYVGLPSLDEAIAVGLQRRGMDPSQTNELFLIETPRLWLEL